MALWENRSARYQRRGDRSILDGVDAPPAPRWLEWGRKREDEEMDEVSIIGVDLAKSTFHVHGAGKDGSAIFRKKLTRRQFPEFMARQQPSTVAMEACGSSNYWARELSLMGHDVRLIAPIYVKPFLKRQKNDAADAEAIVEAAQRPSMRFVEPKTSDQQARAMLFRTREQLVRQRTETINSLRSYLAEFGIIAAQGAVGVSQIKDLLENIEPELPALVLDLAAGLLRRIDQQTVELDGLRKHMNAVSGVGETARRLRTLPGVGPIGALAIETFAPEMSTFRRGRDFASWLGLVPRQHSTGGKQRLGRTTKMGQRDIRRLLISGAMAVIRWAVRRPGSFGPWLQAMLGRKPRLVAAIALANKMARAIWAMMTKNEDYRGSISA